MEVGRSERLGEAPQEQRTKSQVSRHFKEAFCGKRATDRRAQLSRIWLSRHSRAGDWKGAEV